MLNERCVPVGIVRLVWCAVVLATAFTSVSAAGPLAPAQPYRFVVDRDQVDIDKVTAGREDEDRQIRFSGDFIVVPETCGVIPNQSIGNTRFKVFSSKTGSLVHTVRFEDIEDPESGAWIRLLATYGEVGAFHILSDPHRLRVANLRTGEVLATFDLNTDLFWNASYPAFGVVVDHEKVVIMMNRIRWINETTWVNDGTSLHLFYYRTGELVTDAFHRSTEYSYTDRDVFPPPFFSNGRYVLTANLNLNNYKVYLIDLESDSITGFDPDTFPGFPCSDDGLDYYFTPFPRDFWSVSPSGRILLPVHQTGLGGQDRILSADPAAGTFQVLYSSTPEDGTTRKTMIASAAGDGAYFYFLENRGSRVVGYPVPFYDGPFRLDAQCGIESIDVYTADGTAYLPTECLENLNGDVAPGNDHYFNLFRIPVEGGPPTAVTSDFMLYQAWGLRLRAKNGAALLGDDLYVSAQLRPGEFFVDRFPCPPCTDLGGGALSCWTGYGIRLYREDRQITETLFAAVPGASTAEGYEPLVLVQPVLPAGADDGSVAREGARWFRTYRLTAPDGTALEGAAVTAASGETFTTDSRGMVSVGNTAGAPGDYQGRTLFNVISAVTCEGRNYAFALSARQGEEDNFTLAVKPGGLYEKRYDLELGGSISAGIGGGKFLTAKAATLDLQGKAASGVFFNVKDEEGSRYLEMGRHLKAGIGVNAVLAEADLMGAATGSAGAGVSLCAVGSQTFQVADPFDAANTDSRALATAFIWDTLVKNGTLFFPSAGLIIQWIWEHVGGAGLSAAVVEKSAALQAEGEVSAGVEIPALSLAKGGSELSGSNLSLLGLSLPSVSGRFLIEGMLTEYPAPDSDDHTGLGVWVSTAMSLNPGIFSGLLSFADLPEIPAGFDATFGLETTFDQAGAPRRMNLGYMTQKESGELIRVDELRVSFDALNLLEKAALLPDTLETVVTWQNTGSLSWDTKGLTSLFRESLYAAAQGLSGELESHVDMVDETAYDFEIGLGAGVNLGVGASFSYLAHERHLEKRHGIDARVKGMAVVEDRTGLTARFPEQGIGDIMGLTLEYLKDRVASLYHVVSSAVSSGAETVVRSGKAAVVFAGNSLTTGWGVYLSTFTPLSSMAGAALSQSVPPDTAGAIRALAALDSSSASVGEAALLNVVDASTVLVPEFSPANLTFTYTVQDLEAAGLDTEHEPYFFIWKFRAADKKYERLGGVCDAEGNTVSHTQITENGIYGIGYDRTPPSVEVVSPADGTIRGNGTLHLSIRDDFSGVDPASVVVRIDGATVGTGSDPCFDLASGRFILPLSLDQGLHTLSVEVEDTAANSYDTGTSHMTVTDPVDPDDFDGDGVVNALDKFPLDPVHWQDEDNDGIPDDIDQEVTLPGDLSHVQVMDVDFSGGVDLRDLVIALAVHAGKTPTGITLYQGQRIDLEDALFILHEVAGLHQ